MQLPREFLDKINLKLSRHKHPDKLDWIKIRGKWEAQEGDQRFVLIHDDHFGYVIAENKSFGGAVEVEAELEG
jgi:hypothetical protein